MMDLLALLPILLIVALMIGLSWSAAKAGIAGLAVALPIALLDHPPDILSSPRLCDEPQRRHATGLCSAMCRWIISHTPVSGKRGACIRGRASPA
jgi:hypothetical protein